MRTYWYIIAFLIISMIANYTESKIILVMSCISLIFILYKILKGIGVIGEK